MARILADIPDSDIDRLDALAAREGRSRAAAIRDAVKLYLARHGGDRGWIERGSGLWAERATCADGVVGQRADRAPTERR